MAGVVIRAFLLGLLVWAVLLPLFAVVVGVVCGWDSIDWSDREQDDPAAGRAAPERQASPE